MSGKAKGSVAISLAQNTPYAQRLLAAQAWLYSKGKQAHSMRIITVFFLAALTIVVALAVPSGKEWVGTVGGIVTFLVSMFGSDWQQRRCNDAAAIQEAFDTYVFGLPWKELAVDRPSPTLVAQASARYQGNRTEDWYPDTGGVVRPLDVLMCQRSNLGWGASMHRYYAAVLFAGLALLIGVGIAISLVGDLSFSRALTAVFVPILGPIYEIWELIKSNRRSAEVKGATEAKTLELWNEGMKSASGVTIADCREIQDRILEIRKANAHIPDWLDNFRRNQNEQVMQTSAQHLIEEAARHGRIARS